MNIHYFQRYHEKENVDTANLMLLLSRLYHYNSSKFFSFINDLIDTEREIGELQFNLQIKGRGSVPDASISQQSFNIVIETKLHNNFNINQLENHLNSFKNEDYKILLTIDPLFMKNDTKNAIDQIIKEKNLQVVGNRIIHKNTTFEEIIELIEQNIEDRDYEMIDILDDYKQYCLEENLIDQSQQWMRGITAGKTFDSNIKNNLYYDGMEKGFSKHGYIGLYKDKAIKAIGKITKIVTRKVEADGAYTINVEKGSKLTDEEQNRINQAIEDSFNYYGNALNNYSHRFFLVDKFYITNYVKTIGGPIQRAKFFDLAKILNVDKLPEDTEVIAKTLNNRAWEEEIIK